MTAGIISDPPRPRGPTWQQDPVPAFAWRSDFIRTFLDRDLANFGFRVAASTLLRFWRMLGHYHGQLRNAA